MRNLRLLIMSVIMLFSLGIQAQTLHLQLPDTTVNTGETVVIPIIASDFDEIVSMQFSINWDPSVLTYLSFQLADLQFVAIGDTEASSGILRFSWFDILGMGLTMEDGSVILLLEFEVIGEEGDFTHVSITDEPIEIQIFQATDTIGVFEEIELVQDSALVSVGVPIEIMLSVAFETGDVTCFGFDDGFIDVELETNVPSYTITWSGPENFSSSLESINELIAGDYVLQISSESGTPLYDTTIVIMQPELALELSSIAVDTSDCDQPTGQIMAEATGGVLPYSYDVGDGPVGDGGFEGLASGEYFLTVTDANDCIFLDTIQVPAPPEPEIVEITTDTTDCNEASGMAVISVTNGTMPYSYDIGNGPSSNNTITELAADDYAVTVTDARGCTAESSFSIEAPAAPVIESINADTTNCEDATGEAVITATGGLMPYSYDIGDGPSDSNTISGLAAAEYMVTVTDDRGCTVTGSFAIAEPPLPSIDLGEDLEICGEETVELTTDGFETYQWSTGENTASIFVDQTGTYSITVTNTFACEATDTLEVTLADGPELLIENDLLEVCPGDSIQLIVSGGDTYQWIDTSSTLSDLTIAAPQAQPSVTTGYTVISSNECGTDSVSLEVNVFEFNAGAGPDTCIAVGTTAQLSAFGGEVYFWLQPPYPVSQVDIPNPTTEPKDSSTYAVLITDANGCQMIDSITVLVAEDPETIRAINMITPNGDGKNDVLEFPSLNKFNANSLKIYNRWGGLVYQKVNYQVDEERFDGTHNGKPLPAGNYFYVLSLRLGEIKQTLTIVRE